jgi:prepilin-type N-terminal cleavage/methylation domain-containing protein
MEKERIFVKRLKHSKGMTLIEVIVAIAILGIVVVAFLNLFTFGYTHISNAGHRSAAGFQAHQAAEQKIAGGAIDPSIVEAENPTTIIINLPSPLPSMPMTQSGREVSFEAVRNGVRATVTTFVP